MVQEFRSLDSDTPIVLMGYANPIERLGQERFVRDAALAGVDGVLVVDYPPEETVAFAALLKRQRLDGILLVAPTTTTERLDLIASVASGYLYFVGLTGVTGAGHLDTDAVAAHLPRLREHVAVPIAVGFGIRDGASARAIARHADGVVIGSKIVLEIESSAPDQQVQAIERLIQSFRHALDHEDQKESA